MLFQSSGLMGTGRETRGGHWRPGRERSASAAAGTLGAPCVGVSAGACVPAVVGAVGLDAAALGALVHHLAGLQL